MALDVPQPPGATPEKEETQAYEVTVPPNARIGDQLKMTLPNGLQAMITVPEGAAPGSILTFEIPAPGKDDKAAIALQARVRGFVQRAASKRLAAKDLAASFDADAPKTSPKPADPSPKVRARRSAPPPPPRSPPR